MMKSKNGFSLVEVILAIFVISIGLLTLFTLFPAGLKEGEAGHADTHTSLFADYVMSTVRSEVLEVKADQWAGFNYRTILPTGVSAGGNSPDAIRFPENSDLFVRYYLEIEPVGGGIYGVRLWVTSGEYGTTSLNTFKKSAYMYYTEVFFSAMP